MFPSSDQPKTWVRGPLLGRGSFATVHLAVDTSTGKPFAVKSASASNAAIQALENEIKTYKSLKSPYVVSYLGDDTTRDDLSGESRRNLHLEYMPNGTVTDAAINCRKTGSLMKECDIRSYTRCLTEALRYLHDAEIVHGDVKGRNVLFGDNPGLAKLADLGSARRIQEGKEPRLWQGTPLWMAPEVVRGDLPSPASDVWSLGCTVIEMVTGNPPWGSGDDGNILFTIGFGGEAPELPEELSEVGRDFVGKCLRWDAVERWSCEELMEHKFLSEAAKAEMSPRSVFDWVSSELDDDLCSSIASGNEVCLVEAKKRIMGLASGGMVDWDDDDEVWEVVRGDMPMAVRGGAVQSGSFDQVVNYDTDSLICSFSFSFNSTGGTSPVVRGGAYGSGGFRVVNFEKDSLICSSSFGSNGFESCTHQKDDGSVGFSGRCGSLVTLFLLVLSVSLVIYNAYPHFILLVSFWSNVCRKQFWWCLDCSQYVE